MHPPTLKLRRTQPSLKVTAGTAGWLRQASPCQAKLLSVALMFSFGIASANAPITLVKRGSDFYAVDAEKAIRIPTEFVGRELRNAQMDKLATMLNKGDGYLRLSEKKNGQYGIDLSVRGEGGGPLLGQVLGWTVRIVGHGTIVLVGAVQPELIPELIVLDGYIETAANVVTVFASVAPTG